MDKKMGLVSMHARGTFSLHRGHAMLSQFDPRESIAFPCMLYLVGKKRSGASEPKTGSPIRFGLEAIHRISSGENRCQQLGQTTMLFSWTRSERDRPVMAVAVDMVQDQEEGLPHIQRGYGTLPYR